MLSRHTATRHRIRGAVKATRKTINRALDAAEPRLEAAALELQGLGRDAARAVRAKSRVGLAEIRHGYGRLERRVRSRFAPRRQHRGARMALLGAGIAAIAVALLKRS